MSVLVAILALLALLVVGLVIFAWAMRNRVERAVPARGLRIEVDGHHIHYVDSDPEGVDRPAIVLVHGLGGQLQNLTHSLAPLLEDEFRVLAIDRPGSGHSKRARGTGGSVNDYADAVRGFIEALGLERPVVVGHSLGGATAIAVAMRHPQAIRGIVLVAPVTDLPDETPGVFAPLLIHQNWRRHMIAWTLATPLGLRNGKRTAEIVFAPEPVPDDFGTRGGALLGLRPSNFHSATLDLTSLGETLPLLKERYEEITVPVAIIHGTRDVITPFGPNAQAQAPRLHADLKALEGRGHMIPITAAQDVADFVSTHARQWFAEADTSTTAPRTATPLRGEGEPVK